VFTLLPGRDARWHALFLTLGVAFRSAGQKQQSPWKLEQEKDQVRSKIKKDFDQLVTCWSLWKNMNAWVFANERNNGLYRGSGVTGLFSQMV
jgi:hypothetical protein